MANDYKNSFEEDEKKEKAFLDALMEFIGNDRSTRTFLHTTEEESACQSIMQNGFEYEDWAKTTDYIIHGDKIDMGWKLTIRKAYGDFTLVFEMSARNIDEENFQTSNSGINDDPLYVLPTQLVKGYFNKKTKTITKNSNFDPWFTTIKNERKIGHSKNFR
jgi:hypothetical protein